MKSTPRIDELELAIDCTDAVYNDRGTTLPVNVRNDGSGARLPGLARRRDARPLRPRRGPPAADARLPAHLLGLVEALGFYQQAAADAAWSGDATDAVRALAAHPLVRSIDLAERLYAEMARAHRAQLPDRLLPA